MKNTEQNSVSRPPTVCAGYISAIMPVLFLITLMLFFTSHQEGPSLFEDLDRWCDRYHPELSYSACYDKAGI